MDAIGKVEDVGSLGKLEQFAFGCEHEHLVFVQSHLELVHQLQVVVVLQGCPDVRKPFVYAAFSLNSFVTPVRSQSFFGYFVHPFGAYLHFNPFVFWAQHRDVQTFVAVAFGHTEPIAQAFWVGHVHVCYDRVGLPTLHLLLIYGRIDDDTYGKEVVNALEVALLFLHLLPNRVYALCSALHVKAQSSLFQPLLYGRYETFDIAVARLFGGVELIFNHVIGVVFQVFQAQVFQFALQLVQSQLVSEGCIQVTSLLCHLQSRLFVVGIAHLSHQINAVGNHDQYHTHVFGERDKQVSKILALHHRRSFVQLLHLNKPVNDLCYASAKIFFYLCCVAKSSHNARV